MTFIISILIIFGCFYGIYRLILKTSNYTPIPRDPNAPSATAINLKTKELESGSEVCEISSTLPKLKKNAPKIGDKFNTWINPKTGTINFYLKNKGGSEGKISEFNNKRLAKYIEQYNVDGVVFEVNDKEFKSKLYIR